MSASVAIPMGVQKPASEAADSEPTGSSLSTSPITGALQLSTVVSATAAPSLHRISRFPVVNANGEMFNEDVYHWSECSMKMSTSALSES